jgi:hypothetical protein
MFFIPLILGAMQDDKEGYELLLMEVELLKAYKSLPQEVNELIASAQEMRDKGQYDIALVYLEEAVSIINISFTGAGDGSQEENFSFNLISGVDYNRHEFELGFSQSDSTLLDELTKPYIALKTNYTPDNKLFLLQNVLRYDRENFQTELKVGKEKKFTSTALNMSIGAIYDRNYTYSYLGYSEYHADFNFKKTDYLSKWYWNMQNSTRLKKYNNQSETIPDFLRNSFSVYLIRNFGFLNNIQGSYNFDINESLDFSNNDFNEHSSGLKYQQVFFDKLKIITDARHRYYTYQYSFIDTIKNTSLTYTAIPEISYILNPALRFTLNYRMDFKTFKIKSEQEPDYISNYINPSVSINLNGNTSFNLGYVFDSRKHYTQQELDNQYIKDQDFRADGVRATADYSGTNGLFVSFSTEYTFRRYPNSDTNGDFSIYSNRNILNILLFSQIPLTEKISLGIIGSFDNDKDLDIDFNDSVSSFFTLEFSYTF